jgi:hypothetical protein
MAVAAPAARATLPVPQKHALLIGCTRYPFCPQAPELWGPANDIPAYASLLERKFGFASQNIRILLGWPDQVQDRPTGRNIAAAFAQLIERTAAGDSVAIMMNGHGTQLPALAAGPETGHESASRELDGLDEAFLPADIRPGLTGAIRDDQIAHWLAQLDAKGAHVWIVFDCCHCGTMTRDALQRQRWRGLSAVDLGVPVAAMRRARQAATRPAAPDTAGRNAEHPILEQLQVLSRLDQDERGGSIVAFFAAQADELAPELPQPGDAPRQRENYFGLFSYVLAQLLERTDSAVTYRELGRRVASRYRAERGTRGPNPLFQGDLDQTVLATETPRVTRIQLTRQGKHLQLSSGALAGLTQGTVLSVYPPTAVQVHQEDRLAQVRVTRVTPLSAEVEVIKPPVGAEQLEAQRLPPLAWCKIDQIELGTDQLSVALVPAQTADLQGAWNKIHALLTDDDVPLSGLVRLQPHQTDASWLLCPVKADVAARQSDADDSTDQLLLFANNSPAILGQGHRAFSRGAATSPRVVAHYGLDDTARLAQQLYRDLLKIYRWQTLWRLADQATRMRPGNSGLQLQALAVKKLEDVDRVKNRVAARQTLVSGEMVELRFTNVGSEDVWMTLLYLDANFGVQQWASETVRAGQRLEPIVLQVDDDSLGAEGVIALAMPLTATGVVADYAFLTQSPLGIDTRQVRGTPGARATTFERLLYSLGQPQLVRHRSLRHDDPTTPQVVSWTWVSLPERE